MNSLAFVRGRPLSLAPLFLDVEDLCRQSVVPVLQLGEAGPSHLRLKLLPEGAEGGWRKQEFSTELDDDIGTRGGDTASLISDH